MFFCRRALHETNAICVLFRIMEDRAKCEFSTFLKCAKSTNFNISQPLELLKCRTLLTKIAHLRDRVGTDEWWNWERVGTLGNRVVHERNSS